MKGKRIFLACLIWLACIQGTAQVGNYTRISDRFFTAEEYSGLILKSASETVAQENMPASAFESRYDDYRKIIEQISRPLIITKFRWLEKGTTTSPAKGTMAFEKRKEAYARELHRAVRDALHNNPEFLKTITYVDETDRILLFDSYITVTHSGKIEVIETIRIYNGNGGYRSGNDEIKRGIRRSFPTRYENKLGLFSTTGFRVKEVLMNGKSELYELRNAPNGIDVYIGNSMVMLERGVFTYRITYETDRQLIFHRDKDELYWNVNGTGWGFTCDKASCTIRFPEGSKVLEQACYTGIQGSTDNACSSTVGKTGEVYFQTTGRLNPYEGLTVAASVSKGILVQPGQFSQLAGLAKDNAILPALLAFMLLFFLVHFIHWRKKGRDPKPGVIIPRFTPPSGMSPADCGYLAGKKFGPHLFAASLVDHAVNKHVNITVSKEGSLFSHTAYTFSAIAGRTEHNPESYRERNDWYGYDIGSLYGKKVVSGTYDSSFASLYNSLHRKLKERMLLTTGSRNTFGSLFSLNDRYIGVGILLLFLVSFGTVIYLSMYNTRMLIIMSVGILLICLVMQVVFMKIIDAYTPEGRKLADEVLGFRMYLETTEEKKFDMLNPPRLSLQLFEKYLPYAIALKCENEWAEKFSAIIQQAAEKGYEPSYYNSSLGRNQGYTGMASGLSSGLAGTIASASTPPSSSSGGSSGGGSSGGGGGGGGGGGW